MSSCSVSLQLPSSTGALGEADRLEWMVRGLSKEVWRDSLGWTRRQSADWSETIDP